MAEYERVTAYLYQYDQDEKGKNVGFMKAESRGGSVRMQMFVRGADEWCQGRLQVYGLMEKDRGDRGILLGQAVLSAGEGELTWRTEAPEQTLFGLRGICLQQPDAKVCLAGVWKGPAFDRRRYHSGEQKHVANGAEISVPAVQEDVAPVIEVPATTVEEVPAAAVEEVLTEQTPVEQSRTAEDRLQISRFTSPVWELLNRRYGKCRPFAEDRGIQCIQIKPADLSRLTPAYRSLSGNSFLLHGYYRYEHLILIRMEAAVFERRILGGGQFAGSVPRYLVGVPGYYQSGEKNMAGLFGFSDFLSATVRAGTGEGFGYWCTEVQL